MKTLHEKLAALRSRLSPKADAVLARIVSFAAGGLVALMLHYLLFRLTLPSEPFIYAAF